MKEKIYQIGLTLEELKLLDGKVGKTAQEIIDQAKLEESIGFDLPLLNEILRKALKTGQLTWIRKSIRSCLYCDKRYTYHRYKRSSHYHNKGDLNFNKPMYYSGIKFNEGFVTIKGDGDMCLECCQRYQVIEKLIDYIWRKDLPIEIQRNDYRPSKYLQDPHYICKECKKEFPESQMGRKEAVFGGTYPAYCPHCHSEKTSMVNDKWSFIRNPHSLPEVIQVKKTVDEYNEGVGNSDEKLYFLQGKRNPNLFFIQQPSQNYYKFLKFDTEKKNYKLKQANHALETTWKTILEQQGYTMER